MSFIHQIWFQGDPPKKYQSSINSWKKHHPNHKHILWNKNTMEPIVQKYPKLYQTYSQFTHMHQKIDFFKYLILREMGGIYADMDTVCLKPMPFKKLTVSKMPCNFIESWVISGYLETINNGIIVSEKGHPFWDYLLEKIKPIQKSSKMATIQATTGPSNFTKACKEFGIVPVSSKYFEPCYSLDPFCTVKKDSVAVHNHEQTWINPLQKFAISSWFILKYPLFLFIGYIMYIVLKLVLGS